MSETSASSFGKFVPGFDFLQNLAKGATQGLPQMPQLGSWVAPTLSVEELDRRIGELKAVQFWLDQNATALKATIQALEVQKMTLATLKSMNVSMTEMANAFKLTPTADDGAGSATARAAESLKARAAARAAASAPAEAPAQAAGTAPGMIDPLQWWGALTQQFQQIAAAAMQEAAAKAVPPAAAAAAAPEVAAPAPASVGKTAASAHGKAATARKTVRKATD